jgi:hypothetical protein
VSLAVRIRSILLSSLALGASLAVITACTSTKPPAFPTAPVTVTTAQFQSLGWLAGRWHGTGAGMSFYESYAVLDDSTIQAFGWSDSTFAQATDSSQLRLRSGQVSRGRGEEARYVATAWDSTALHFEPRGGATNAFTWRKESADAWVATLTWTDNEGKAQGRVYKMARIP